MSTTPSNHEPGGPPQPLQETMGAEGMTPGEPLEDKANKPDAASSPDATEDLGTNVDPDFVPDEKRETPEQRRAREHPEEFGS